MSSVGMLAMNFESIVSMVLVICSARGFIIGSLYLRNHDQSGFYQGTSLRASYTNSIKMLSAAGLQISHPIASI